MTVPLKSEAQGTRARLLDAARYLFWEKGYSATGMAELLERAVETFFGRLRRDVHVTGDLRERKILAVTQEESVPVTICQ